jgi:hypothetical protein
VHIPLTPASSPPQTAAAQENIAAQVAAQRANKNLLVREYLGRDKASLRTLSNEYHPEYASTPARRAERARAAALPLDDPARLRYEQLHAAAKLVHNAIGAGKRAVARPKQLRDRYEQRYLGGGADTACGSTTDSGWRRRRTFAAYLAGERRKGLAAGKVSSAES